MIRRLARTVPGVRESHGVRFHRVGDQLFLTLHCLVDEQLPVTQAHDAATQVEERLSTACPDVAGVSVHIEPTEADPLH